MVLHAQLDPVLVQLMSIKCCNAPCIVLRADDSVVHEVYRTADLMEFTVQSKEYCAKSHTSRCMVPPNQLRRSWHGKSTQFLTLQTELERRDWAPESAGRRHNSSPEPLEWKLPHVLHASCLKAVWAVLTEQGLCSPFPDLLNAT